MNKIDEIRAKLNSIMIGIDFVEREEIINEIIMELTPYLSHGITEEDAFNLSLELRHNNANEVITGCRALGLITSSREPIAEPESLVKAREAVEYARRLYNASIEIDENETHTAYPQCIDLKDELELLVEELEARVKELEGK